MVFDGKMELKYHTHSETVNVTEMIGFIISFCAFSASGIELGQAREDEL